MWRIIQRLPAGATPPVERALFERGEIGAGEGNRTLDTELGKLVLYH